MILRVATVLPASTAPCRGSVARVTPGQRLSAARRVRSTRNTPRGVGKSVDPAGLRARLPKARADHGVGDLLRRRVLADIVVGQSSDVDCARPSARRVSISRASSGLPCAVDVDPRRPPRCGRARAPRLARSEPTRTAYRWRSSGRRSVGRLIALGPGSEGARAARAAEMIDGTSCSTVGCPASVATAMPHTGSVAVGAGCSSPVVSLLPATPVTPSPAGDPRSRPMTKARSRRRAARRCRGRQAPESRQCAVAQTPNFEVLADLCRPFAAGDQADVRRLALERVLERPFVVDAVGW